MGGVGIRLEDAHRAMAYWRVLTGELSVRPIGGSGLCRLWLADGESATKRATSAPICSFTASAPQRRVNQRRSTRCCATGKSTGLSTTAYFIS